MSEIILRFINTDTFIGRAIDEVTWGAGGVFSHVELCVDDGYLGAQAPNGVRLRPKHYCEPTTEVFCRIEVPDDVHSAIMDFAHAQIGRGYNFSAVAGVLLHADISESNSWDCAQFVGYAFAQAGFPLLRTTEFNRLTPSVLSLSPYLVVVE